MAPTTQEMLDFIARLNRFPWGQADEITPEAEALIERHVERMRSVLRHLQETQRLDLTDAEMRASTPGHGVPGYDVFIRSLLQGVDFSGAYGREHLTVNLAAFFFWQYDPELASFDNPWAPLVELYEKGYTTSGGVDQRDDELLILLWCRAGSRSYRIV